ncbi:MAG: bile acid:sodium symporter family protein [Pseudomonadota bacterium]
MPDTFFWLMAITVALAFAFPHIGRPDGILQLGLVTKIGVVLVFFIYGASFNAPALAAGLRNWRVHLIIQASTFVLFPIIGLILYAIAKAFLTAPLDLGFFFLAALPSTISSSVALTGIARGNVPAAVFNATLSGLIGLFATPALVALVVSSEQGNIQVLEAIVQIILILLAPFAAGQALRFWFSSFFDRHMQFIRGFDRGVILLIIFTSFAGSVHNGLWQRFSLYELVITGLMVACALGLGLIVTINVSRAAGLSLADEAAVVFCGTTKSLANGVPISQVLFAGMPGVVLLLLPLLLFHQFQLFVFGIMAKQYAKQTQKQP